MSRQLAAFASCVLAYTQVATARAEPALVDAAIFAPHAELTYTVAPAPRVRSGAASSSAKRYNLAIAFLAVSDRRSSRKPEGHLSASAPKVAELESIPIGDDD